MTLEQASTQALQAAMTGDLDALQQALTARAEAIAELKRAAPTAELAARFQAALGNGEAILQALLALKRTHGFESGRLAQLETGLATGLGSCGRPPRFDVRG
jgi:hypothetical protein